MDRQTVTIDSGYDVIGSDGNKIGSVKGCTERYCHIDTGFLGLGQDYYVPLSDISGVRQGQIRLDIPSDQIGNMGWEQRPNDLGERTTEFQVVEGRLEYARSPREYATPPQDYGEPSEDEFGAPGSTSRSMPLTEEELRLRKERAARGEVEIGKRVEEQERNVDVPVTHEEAVVRERPVDEPTDRPIGEGETIRMPLTEERVTPEKETRVYGEVEVEKRKVTEHEQFGDTVRREVPEVHKKGDVDEVVDEEPDLPEGKHEDEDEAA